MLSRPLGKLTRSRAKESTWKADSFQRLVEWISTRQTLKITWQSHSVQLLVEVFSKCQAPKTIWQGHSGFLSNLSPNVKLWRPLETHSFQGLVECISKCHARKNTWKVDSFQVLVKLKAERNAVKTTWQVDPVQEPRSPLGKQTPSRDWWNESPHVKLWRSRGRSLSPASGWSLFQMSSSKDHLARSLRLLVKFVAKCQALKTTWNTLFPGSCWMHFQMSCSEEHFWKSTPFRFWLNSKPKEMLSRPLGKLTRSRAKESTWKADSFQRLVEWISTRQTLKITWQGHSVQLLVEVFSKCQAPKTIWQGHSGFWSNLSPNVKLWRPLGKPTWSRVLLDAFPNVKLWRLLGSCCKYTPESVPCILITPRARSSETWSPLM